MTDRDVEQGSQRRNGAPGAGGPAGTARAGAAAAAPKAGKRADPTEPEVPSAKRVRTIRRQRSMLLVASAILALVSIIGFLLFKAGQRVTTSAAASSAASAIGVTDRAPSELATVKPAEPLPEPAVAGSATVPTNSTALPMQSSAPSVAVPRTKASAPSTDIFRKPAF
jgi:cytoskeletal protein RodZ